MSAGTAPGRAPAAPREEARARRRKVMFFIAYPQRMAGANRSLFELVTHLPPEIEPVVVSAGEGAVPGCYRDAGIASVVLPAPGGLGVFGKEVLRRSAAGKAWIAARDLLPYTLRLRRWIVENGIDVVHVNDPRGAAIAVPAARLAGRPVVAHLRGEIPFGRMARFLFERAGDRIVTVSEGVRQTLSPAGRARARTVYNGIRELPPPRRRIGWLDALREEGVAVVACFASVVPFKGHHHLVRAAAELERRGLGESFVVLCVGDLVPEHAEYQAWLAGLRAELGVRTVTFTGWQDDPFLFYQHADVTVLPSVTHERLALGGREVEVLGNEGFPRTHLEAMRFGLPVVGTRIAGVPEQVVHGETGLLVEPGDAVGLADALEEMVRSPERRRRMGARGRERVARLFSTAAYVRGVMDVYDSLAR